MKEKIRVTLNNSRTGSGKHNDRTFDISKAEHIDPERSAGNWYWHIYQKNDSGMTFDEAEARFYEAHFSDALADQNRRAEQARHPERVRSLDEYRRARKTQPEETLYYLGNSKNTVAAETLRDIVREQIRWERKTFPQVKILDVALHVDEEGAPHIHKRSVWMCHDKNGMEAVGQSKALQEMGVQRPDMTKPESRGNNAKMTYTRECREHLQQLCKARGIDIETEPRHKSKSGRILEDYKAEQAEARAEKARQECDRLTQSNAILTQKLQQAEKTVHDAEKRAEQAEKALTDTLEQTQTALQGLRDILNEKARASEIHKLFGDRETQTYHKNMLESTRAIGDDAYRYYQQALELTQEQTRREKAIQQAEKKSQQDRQQAEKLRQDMETRIQEQARKYFEDFKTKTFGTVKDSDRLERLEAFVFEYNINGRCMLDVFEEQEQELREQVEQEWSR